ncbi:hypothetical protein ROLI_034870 [Roseobacter fucihabitans]|uniref:Phosphonate metabolism protein n=1 Tax=Roseobacter fucihabitans TaxID=1537242 RepID=A0ABZ2BWG2_9RHOB|nr:DUF1045 domain-containing protein [Roseobacter litoralis]MBC6966878.1 hypothetical protein [Roseobacter litoralis]
MNFTRYGVYFTPHPGAFADAGAAWLGWDIAAGQPVEGGAGDITSRPRKYGFHATLKAPFRLRAGSGEDQLRTALAALSTTLAPVALDGLTLSRIGAFVALTPIGDTQALTSLAACVVRDLDGLRAPLGADELARRHHPNFTPLQKENLRRWGYPHVMEAFKFHITLTGPLPRAIFGKVMADATAHFADLVPRPFLMNSLTLVGEGGDGMFREIHRYTLTGR